jgi:hypothetical protein
VWTDVPGATGTTYAFAPDLGHDQDVYRAVFSNRTGSLPSAAVRLTVSPKPDPGTPAGAGTGPGTSTGSGSTGAPAGGGTSTSKPPTPTKSPAGKPVPAGTVSATLAAATVMVGERTVLSGKAKAHAVVAVYGYTQPSTKYHLLAKVKADTQGHYVFRVHLKANSRLFVKAAGMHRSRTVAEHVRATVTFTVTKLSSYTYAFAGTVSPARAREQVAIYYRIPYGQLLLARGVTDRSGHFRIERALRAYGQHYYSVFAVVGTDGVVLGNHSADRAISVYRAV